MRSILSVLFFLTCSITCQGQSQPADSVQQFIIGSVSVTGLNIHNDYMISLVKDMAELHEGDTIMAMDSARMRAINNLNSSKLYKTIRVIANPNGDKIDFEMYLQETNPVPTLPDLYVPEKTNPSGVAILALILFVVTVLIIYFVFWGIGKA